MLCSPIQTNFEQGFYVQIGKCYNLKIIASKKGGFIHTHWDSFVVMTSNGEKNARPIGQLDAIALKVRNHASETEFTFEVIWIWWELLYQILFFLFVKKS